MKYFLTANLEKLHPCVLEQISHLGTSANMTFAAMYSCKELSFFLPSWPHRTFLFSCLSFSQGGWEVCIWEWPPVISSWETCYQAALERAVRGSSASVHEASAFLPLACSLQSGVCRAGEGSGGGSGTVSFCASVFTYIEYIYKTCNLTFPLKIVAKACVYYPTFFRSITNDISHHILNMWSASCSLLL